MVTNFVICKCGEKVKFPTGGYNVGTFTEKTGWGVVPTFNGELIRMCPICHNKVIDLCFQLLELTGSKYVSTSNVISWSERNAEK